MAVVDFFRLPSGRIQFIFIIILRINVIATVPVHRARRPNYFLVQSFRSDIKSRVNYTCVNFFFLVHVANYLCKKEKKCNPRFFFQK